ncbi:Alpha/Beta hydrolase protein [Mycena capillaripes]|nr:Alpha/Beta hydrolase protein [Mycena capillaripes]
MSLASLHKCLHVAFIFLVSVRAVDSATTPVVDLGYAQYQGVVDATLNITSFRGIRYAAPPTGPLRWQAPSPPSKVGGVQQAVTDPLQCYQGALSGFLTNPLGARDIEQTEDCLFLSVYSPAQNSTALLPTIVWIHGGGYVMGAGSSFYNGAELVQESNNQVVVVVIQYRLGVFGFLAGQQIKDGGALNVGLLDQDFALRWVNKNSIASGDPNKVAIWGQSAGAGSVLQHVIARNGETSPPLFRAAITSSTYLGSQYQYNHTIPQTAFNEVVTQAGCNDTKPLDCLRALDGATLEEINLNMILTDFQGIFPFSPVVDGSFITQTPTDVLLHGKHNGDILLSVTNVNEGILFINQSVQYNVTEYIGNLFPLFGAKEKNDTASLYESSFGASPLDQVNRILAEGEAFFPGYCAKISSARSGIYLSHGVYAVPPSLHGDDVIYYFPSYSEFNNTLNFNNTAFINAFSQVFLSFAANLDPNEKLRPSITPAWPKWSRIAETEMVFKKTELNAPSVAPANTSSALLERCEFWKSLRQLTAQ